MIRTYTPETFLIPCPDDPTPKQIHVQYEHESALEILSQLPDRGLAIVGPRNPSHRAESLLRTELLKLRDQNLVILSGFARGIDAAAHEMAIEIGLPTVAIVGSGLNINYPQQHASLRKKILERGGLILSEFHHDKEPKPYAFLQRNRLIAYWSKALWVVEAQRKSGTLNTATWARDYHRDVYATPSFPGEIKNIGAQDLIDQHCARTFWGIHSLGQTWMEFATLREVSSNEKKSWDAPPLF